MICGHSSTAPAMRDHIKCSDLVFRTNFESGIEIFDASHLLQRIETVVEWRMGSRRRVPCGCNSPVIGSRKVLVMGVDRSRGGAEISIIVPEVCVLASDPRL